MGFGEAISHCFSNYAGFQGRARRSEYWFWQLFLLLVIIAFVVVAAAVAGSVGPQNRAWLGLAIILMLLFYFLGLFIPSLAVTVRRLHDINLSGWFILLNLIPYAGGLILFVMTVLPGTKGENKFGPDSRPDGIAEVF